MRTISVSVAYTKKHIKPQAPCITFIRLKSTQNGEKDEQQEPTLSCYCQTLHIWNENRHYLLFPSYPHNKATFINARLGCRPALLSFVEIVIWWKHERCAIRPDSQSAPQTRSYRFMHQVLQFQVDHKVIGDAPSPRFQAGWGLWRWPALPSSPNCVLPRESLAGWVMPKHYCSLSSIFSLQHQQLNDLESIALRLFIFIVTFMWLNRWYFVKKTARVWNCSAGQSRCMHKLIYTVPNIYM